MLLVLTAVSLVCKAHRDGNVTADAKWWALYGNQKPANANGCNDATKMAMSSAALWHASNHEEGESGSRWYISCHEIRQSNIRTTRYESCKFANPGIAGLSWNSCRFIQAVALASHLLKSTSDFETCSSVKLSLPDRKR
jgi:hypothetical protein